MQSWKTTAAGAEATPVSSSALTDVRVSPDGSSLFFTNSGPGLWQMLAGGSASPVKGLEQRRFGWLWAVTDRGLYFVDGTVDRLTLQFYDFQTGTSRIVLTLPAQPLIG